MNEITICSGVTFLQNKLSFLSSCGQLKNKIKTNKVNQGFVWPSFFSENNTKE
jgi:hypothetical protein